MVATDGTRVVRVPTPLDPDVVLWIPPSTTLTAASRTALPDAVPFADAVFNVGRTAVLVAALAAGDVGSLRAATEDRLHQSVRLAATPGSADALAAGLDAGAWCGWLSGSGPTVAFLAERGSGETVAAGLPDDGQVKIERLDRSGVGRRHRPPVTSPRNGKPGILPETAATARRTVDRDGRQRSHPDRPEGRHRRRR